MTAQITGDPVLSAFTLTVLKESGWYLPDFNMA